MSNMYRFSLEESESARFLVENYRRASARLARFMPKAELRMLPSGPDAVARLRWVAVGKRRLHPVYLFVRYDEGKGAFMLVNRPRYPAYLMGFIGAMVLAGFHPAAVFNTGRDLRALVAEDPGRALSIAVEGLRRGVVSGRRFLDYPDISYEGFLYRVPIGLLAFLNEKPPLKPVDVITGHVEYEEWVHPLEIAANAVRLAQKREGGGEKA